MNKLTRSEVLKKIREGTYWSKETKEVKEIKETKEARFEVMSRLFSRYIGVKINDNNYFINIGD